MSDLPVADLVLRNAKVVTRKVERETGRISLRCSIVHADGASEANLTRVAALRGGVLVQNRLLLEGADHVRAWGQDAADASPRIGVMRNSASRLAAARTRPGRTGIRPGRRSGGWSPAVPSTARPADTSATG